MSSRAALPRGVRILSANGWSDANVPPVTFGPEQQLLLANAGRPTYAATPPTIFSIGAASVAAHTFANITHEMIDSAQSGSPPGIVSNGTNAIGKPDRPPPRF